MPALNNGPEFIGNGGPSVGGRNGGSSFINGKGNASAKGNGIAQINSNGSSVVDPTEYLVGEDGKPAPGASVVEDNGVKLNRAEETDDASSTPQIGLLAAVRELVIPFIKAADDAAAQKHTGTTYRAPSGEERNVLVDYLKPADLVARLKLSLPEGGEGKEGLLDTIDKVLKFSVNTWDQGFMDKLFSTNTPVGVISDLVLSVLNTNSHVYQVSPALTVVEKTTARALANKFGFTGPHAGGITCQGGSSSNLTSLIVARNTLYPECRTAGNAARDFVVFTSAHGHYSVEKSAMVSGMGSGAVWPVPVDEAGRMRTDRLRELVVRAKAEGKTPFYVNATAGTTVRGSYDPFEDIAAVCREHGLWMHIDASFGGPVIFSRKHAWKLRGSHLADSLTVNPHKMMHVPTTCSFLLGPDMAVFNRANTTSAGYLFHGDGAGDEEVWDLADLSLQCGRRPDALKLALAWQYYGSDGFERQIDGAFDVAEHLFNAIRESPRLALVAPELPACLQVCFYYAPAGGDVSGDRAVNTERTASIVRRLIPRGFMVDFAPGDKGSFLRVVVNCLTLKSTIDGLVKAIIEVGQELYG